MSFTHSDGPSKPFFERAGSVEQETKRLLVVSYSFPPDEVVGARRWAKLAHFAAARGFGLDVISKSPTDVTPSGQSALDELPPGVRVFDLPNRELVLDRLEHSTWHIYERLRLRGAALRSSEPGGGNGTIGGTNARRPDAVHRDDVRWSLHTVRGLLRVAWVLREVARFNDMASRAARLGESLFVEGVHRVVIGNGPPHWTYEAARRIAKSTGAPYVMDMRDPWSSAERVPEFFASPFWLRVAERQERRTVRNASLIVANTEHARRVLAARHPGAAARTIAVMNGADNDPIPPSQHGDKFTIVFAGTVYVHTHVRTLFRAARRAVDQLGLTPDQFGIEMVGDLDGLAGTAPAAEIAREENLAAFVKVGPRRSHADVVSLLARAALLVALPAFDAASIPGKVFECSRFDAWFLVLAEPQSAAAVLLQGTRADVVAPDDLDGVAAAIQKHACEFLTQGARPRRIVDDDRFSRERQARILFDSLVALDRQSEASEATDSAHQTVHNA